MAFKLGDRVRETSTTTGTGTLSLAGAAVGYQSFASVLANGDTCWYAAAMGPHWEVGRGTFATGSPPTLARTTVIASSNGAAAVDFPAGDKDVFITVPATALEALALISAFTRTLLDDASAAEARVTLGVRNQAFSVNKGGANQSGIASGVITKVTFGIEAYDQGGYYDQSLHRWTPPAGNVQVQAMVAYAAGIVDQTAPRVFIYKNGSAFAYSIQNTSGTGGVSIAVSAEDVANGTDYYEVFFFNASGIDMTISGSQELTSFCGKVL
ncbi:MAG TPA: hypothetical protein VGO06_13645 [Bosea sp. (in: a-proteobacteria)]|jgi:hypothetical protein|uniref:hypothetical protein n=1 Tax=Bosea sp. (in: a-proteobacteria) TaxID=1871050 RepID=UPI002E12193D|nr:hypothetical protein [Bosea sp. (in: a-proteobacteria)]